MNLSHSFFWKSWKGKVQAESQVWQLISYIWLGLRWFSSRLSKLFTNFTYENAQHFIDFPFMPYCAVFRRNIAVRVCIPLHTIFQKLLLKLKKIYFLWIFDNLWNHRFGSKLKKYVFKGSRKKGKILQQVEKNMNQL